MESSLRKDQNRGGRDGKIGALSADDQQPQFGDWGRVKVGGREVGW